MTVKYKKLSCRKETVRLLRGSVLDGFNGGRYFAHIIGLSSTTVTKSACKAIEFGEITQNKAIMPVKVILGHRCRYQKTRMNDLSCDIRMWAQVSFILSQFTHLTDRQTDGQKGLGNTVRCSICRRTVKTSLSTGSCKSTYVAMFFLLENSH